MGTAELLQMFLGKGCHLPKVTLSPQGWPTSNDCLMQRYKASPISYPLDSTQDISEELLQLQKNYGTSWEFCYNYLTGQHFLFPVLLSSISKRGCFLKHSPIFLRLSFLQNQAIVTWYQEEEAVSKNGILEINYSWDIWQWESHHWDRWKAGSLWHDSGGIINTSSEMEW